jgi:CheY-like chemotaxis protein
VNPPQSTLADTADPLRPSPAIPKGSSDRVLLVEDNPLNQQVAIVMLESLGFCVDVVDNGVEAVIAATMVPYGVILMDCEIPVLNGYEVTKEIRSQLGASRHSPIIAVTSSTKASDRQRCLAVGMDGHISKPLTLASLTGGMARWAPNLSRLTLVPDLEEDDVDENDPPVLDTEVVDSLKRLGAEAGEDLLGQVATLFLADSEARMKALHQALVDEDGPALIHSAHTMCGSSANVGAAELARLCAKLATNGTVGDLEDAETLLHAVETELARVRTALTAPGAASTTGP